MKRHQQLPNPGPEREALREKGQFWTPSWVAEAMVSYVLESGVKRIFDPAVGDGAFFRAAKSVAAEKGIRITLLGSEIDPTALQQARKSGLSDADLRGVQITDFALSPPREGYKAIVANPPYIRHHRLSRDTKAKLKRIALQTIGTPLDGRAGFHVYFLIRALQLLEKDGRLAFIMPADTCEGVFAGTLWHWVTGNYCLEVVVTFDHEATPFPGVDTNAVIFMISNCPPKDRFYWARCLKADTQDLKQWVQSGFIRKSRDMCVQERYLAEGLAHGLSRPMRASHNGPFLLDYAKVQRGIVTGANEFFFMTREQAKESGIPQEFFITAVGRTRDVPSDEITLDTIRDLEMRGRPTLLLSLDGRASERLPEVVGKYLRKGESLGLPQRPLMAMRSHWYKMETRKIPPILFAYLGRRNARFIRNRAGVVPLTGFLCIYPVFDNPIFVEKLFWVLRHPKTIAGLALVGKSYGGGAIKVEPRALERLPIPLDIIEESGIEQMHNIRRSEQMDIFSGLPRPVTKTAERKALILAT